MPKSDVCLRGWSLLAILALALAGLFAVLLVLSRTPFLDEAIAWPDRFFQKGLVAHVVFSFVVWFLSILACLSYYGRGKGIVLSSLAAWRNHLPLFLASIGVVLLLVSPFVGEGEPSLNNYIPVIIDPLFYAGLIFVAIGVLAVVVSSLTDAGHAVRPISVDQFLIITCGLLFIAALIGFAVAFAQLERQTLDFDYNEQLMWGGGHLLQFVNLALLLIAWNKLSRETVIGSLISRRTAQLASGLLVISVAAGLSFFGLFAIGSESFTTAFTYLQFALAPPLLVFLFYAAPIIWRKRRHIRTSDPASLCLLSSLVVFLVGATLGLFVDGADTRTPAHYHGVIGGLNLAFVGLFYSLFLPSLHRTPRYGRGLWFQIWAYAVGQFLFVIGMFAAGVMGASRKTAGTAIDLDSFGAIAATVVRDIGGALSIIGGVAFIYIAGRALLAKPAPPGAATIISVGREEDFSS